MKKFIALVAFCLFLTGCGVGTYSVQSGSQDVAYISFTDDVKQDIVVNVDDKTYNVETVKQKAYKSDSSTPIQRPISAAIVGGGNVAMDAARCAKRLGAQNVYIVYRRSESELPARAEEIEHAKEEGIIFKTLTNPYEIKGDENGFVKTLLCSEMELGEPDASGRRRPIEKEGSCVAIDCDCVIMSIGTSPNPLIKSTTNGLETNKHGCIVADENGSTSIPGVFAGGDAVTGAATVILAMGAGKTAAKSIDEYIRTK